MNELFLFNMVDTKGINIGDCLQDHLSDSIEVGYDGISMLVPLSQTAKHQFLDSVLNSLTFAKETRTFRDTYKESALVVTDQNFIVKGIIRF